MDLVTDSLVPGHDPLLIDWRETSLNAYNPGHYLRYEVDPGSTTTSAGGTYNLVQFHYHSLSEHTVNGEHLDMEVHFVHENAEDPGQLLVVAMFIDSEGDTETDMLSAAGPLRFHGALALPVSEEITALGATANLAPFGATVTSHASYEGSLTTPPCTEGVWFYVSGSILAASTEDISAFTALYDHNYRPVQPLNGRSVTYHDPGMSGR